jgi:fused signal recognition particle receptor
VAGRLADGLSRAKGSFGQGLRRLLAGGRPVGADLYEELTETLVLGDTGVAAATAAVDELRRLAEGTGVVDADGLRRLLAQVIARRLGPAGGLDLPAPPDPTGGDSGGSAAGGLGVILVVGVNGTGKTTTVAKLAARLLAEGRHPLLAQADTFRAAATEQTLVWAGRLGLEVVHHRAGSDPAAVAFDGVRAAIARGNDVLLVDTAGRLHTKTGLIEELKKVARVLGREVPGAPHERLLVVDGTAGLNSLEQARVFGEAVSLTGIVITKLDGTARGGVVLAIREQFGLPVKFVGVGEGLDDLVPFDPEVYAGELLL